MVKPPQGDASIDTRTSMNYVLFECELDRDYVY